MSENGPALLEIPGHERLQMLSMNCQTTKDQLKGRQINEETKQDTSWKAIALNYLPTNKEIIRIWTTLFQVHTWKLTEWQVQK